MYVPRLDRFGQVVEGVAPLSSLFRNACHVHSAQLRRADVCMCKQHFRVETKVNLLPLFEDDVVP